MFAGAAKDNANPIVHAVPKRDEVKKSRSNFGSSYVERYNMIGGDPASDDEDDSEPSLGYLSVSTARTADERSVYMALAAVASSSSTPDALLLLRAGGFVLPSAVSDSSKKLSRTRNRGPLSEPHFIPSKALQERSEFHRGESTSQRDAIDGEEVFDIIRNIQDPEHPLTLEQLNVVNVEHIEVRDVALTGQAASSDPSGKKTFSLVDVRFTPTIPHCSMATLIGLSIRVKLLRSLPSRFKVRVRINPGTHASETAVNKQLDDKERVCAALENAHLLGVVNKCIANGMKSAISTT
uniref:MIP18 family-like domain-containing protein n=1 Tax=Attheya septentrionalis TaxID=420275 RepID=A0A7S2UKE7_9STRA|mmetsp:Transcript_29/g.55  ORF Transcript_29/g.55 Transcript_29/m.55 type:complete len:295 (+) Transcript_29:213-1097(+)|eukprot:CAMPEP_0198297558 /NCGR_PEP_ID=MMETSP1449-20131203/37205_1 /TAXON_ID=420275 /ORGANISM="Attheya septentrionalis, Strain CCMP2084" /LENGTH=294 /DNA_ID=CAMNT_0043998521 /DNA_START=141 /DNA_END=1025 /DNA_ORIENTATION=+